MKRNFVNTEIVPVKGKNFTGKESDYTRLCSAIRIQKITFGLHWQPASALSCYLLPLCANNSCSFLIYLKH